MTTEATQRKRAGWPARLSETAMLRVEIRRDIETRSNVIVAGTRGRLNRYPPSSWHRFSFVADPCASCKCSLAASALSWRDFRILGAAEAGA
jgi:hypothetical protein